MSGGQLILAATPLGNVLDASPRLKQTLTEADLIAAEDTRKAKRLIQDLNLDIKAPIISFFEENEIEKIPELINKLKQGSKIVVISDAGTPAISDPGFKLVKQAITENISITVIPGPSAVLSALVLSGLPTDRFSFEGFIPRKGKERSEILNNLNKESRTMIIFESPRRTKETLEDIKEVYEIIEPIIESYCNQMIDTCELDCLTYDKIFKSLKGVRTNKKNIEYLQTLLIRKE